MYEHVIHLFYLNLKFYCAFQNYSVTLSFRGETYMICVVGIFVEPACGKRDSCNNVCTVNVSASIRSCPGSVSHLRCKRDSCNNVRTVYVSAPISPSVRPSGLVRTLTHICVVSEIVVTMCARCM